MATKVQCDRCKKIVDPNEVNKISEQYIGLEIDKWVKDLCGDCCKQLYKWYEDAQLTLSSPQWR